MLQTDANVKFREACATLGLPTGNITFEMAKAAFKSQAMRVHPDKGGTDALFQIVKEAFKEVCTYITLTTTSEHQELKAAFAQISNPLSSEEYARGMTGGDGRLNNAAFNAHFEKTRVATAFDRGYGDMMAPSTKTREDISVPVAKGFAPAMKAKAFNRAFDAATPAVVKQQVAIYKAPEALVSCQKVGFAELGVDHVDDFSGENTGNRGLHFTDYMAAYNTQRLVDPKSVSRRKTFNSIDDLEKYRESSKSTKMTRRLQHEIGHDAQVDQERELRRKETLQQLDLMYETAERKRLMLKV
jgi:hypothetical protein